MKVDEEMSESMDDNIGDRHGCSVHLVSDRLRAGSQREPSCPLARSSRCLCAGTLPSGHRLHRRSDTASVDAAGNLSPTLNLDQLVAHVAGNAPGGTDHESLSDLQVTVKAPDHFGVGYRGCPPEQATMGDLQFLARY